MLAGWISLSLTNFFDSSTYTTLSFKQAIGPFEWKYIYNSFILTIYKPIIL